MNARKKPPGRCIFCNGLGMSKEHFWPTWTGGVLPKRVGVRHVRELHVFEGKPQVQTQPPLKVERNGDINTTKIRVVCRNRCNAGWMSRLETAAKPFLMPLISGAEAVLPPDAQCLVATWIAMKVMVAEHAEQGVALTPPEDRRAMMDGDVIPAYYSIRIGKHVVPQLHGAFRRHSATLVRPEPGTVPMPPRRDLPRNVQDISFIIGALYVHVLAIRDANIDADQLMAFKDSALPRIWPPREAALSWPPERLITRADLPNLLSGLETLIRQPNVHWMPLPR